jgi:hypothetical protein
MPFLDFSAGKFNYKKVHSLEYVYVYYKIHILYADDATQLRDQLTRLEEYEGVYHKDVGMDVKKLNGKLPKGSPAQLNIFESCKKAIMELLLICKLNSSETYRAVILSTKDRKFHEHLARGGGFSDWEDRRGNDWMGYLTGEIRRLARNGGLERRKSQLEIQLLLMFSPCTNKTASRHRNRRR